MVTVSYRGFLGPVVRQFPDKESAIRWVLAIGKKEHDVMIVVAA